VGLVDTLNNKQSNKRPPPTDNLEATPVGLVDTPVGLVDTLPPVATLNNKQSNKLPPPTDNLEATPVLLVATLLPAYFQADLGTVLPAYFQADLGTVRLDSKVGTVPLDSKVGTVRLSKNKPQRSLKLASAALWSVKPQQQRSHPKSARPLLGGFNYGTFTVNF